MGHEKLEAIAFAEWIQDVDKKQSIKATCQRKFNPKEPTVWYVHDTTEYCRNALPEGVFLTTEELYDYWRDGKFRKLKIRNIEGNMIDGYPDVEYTWNAWAKALESLVGIYKVNDNSKIEKYKVVDKEDTMEHYLMIVELRATTDESDNTSSISFPKGN